MQALLPIDPALLPPDACPKSENLESLVVAVLVDGQEWGTGVSSFLSLCAVEAATAIVAQAFDALCV